MHTGIIVCITTLVTVKISSLKVILNKIYCTMPWNYLPQRQVSFVNINPVRQEKFSDKSWSDISENTDISEYFFQKSANNLLHMQLPLMATYPRWHVFSVGTCSEASENKLFMYTWNELKY